MEHNMTQQVYSERTLIQGGPPLTITLNTGEQVDYRLSMDSLAALEDSFGSLTAMRDQVAKANDAMAAGEGQLKMMRTVIDMIAMGVRHVPWTDPVTGERVRLGMARQLVGELLDPTRLQEYMTTVGLALQAAFGTPAGGGPNPPMAPAQTPAPPTTTGPFPGAAGGTSPQSPPAAPMQSFGL